MQARTPPTVLEVSGEQHKKDTEVGRDTQKIPNLLQQKKLIKKQLAKQHQSTKR